MKIESWQLRQRQNAPLEIKERLTENRIRAWYEYWKGEVCVSFSGGKDSTVLLHQVRKYYPDVEAVFVDTGLEYPEIRDFVKTIDNVIWVKPEMPFSKVIKNYGYPVASKKTAKMIRQLQNPSRKNIASRLLYFTGITSTGKTAPSFKLAKKWYRLITSKFKISEQCCDIIKKEPLKKYAKRTGKKAYVGLMAADSQQRESSYLKTGCNSFNGNKISRPIAFWVESDIWNYIKKYNLPYSKIYDTGVKRTGCMFCMFGVHLEKGKNRFQLMQRTHPKQWNYCINKLGCGELLDFIGVNYKDDQLDLF